MKRLLILLGVPLFIAFTALGVSQISQQKELNESLDIQLDQREIRIKTLEQKQNELLDNLENQKDQTKEHKERNEQLQKEIEQLERDLQAKLDRQKQIAVEREQLEQASRTATGTAVASAYSGGGNKDTWLAQSGIPRDQWASVDFIVSRESGWNPDAVNPSSGACGLGQQLPCGKWAGAWNDPVAALKAQYQYVTERYGGYNQAVAFWQANHWY